MLKITQQMKIFKDTYFSWISDVSLTNQKLTYHFSETPKYPENIKELILNQKDIPQEFKDVVDEFFWDLLEEDK